jgi:hypothetical protein
MNENGSFPTTVAQKNLQYYALDSAKLLTVVCIITDSEAGPDPNAPGPLE